MQVVTKFKIGQVVRHRFLPFRGIIFDIDPDFQGTEEWWQSIPEKFRPRKDQPFYRLLAEDAVQYYEAYVSEQNLVLDEAAGPVDHPAAAIMFQSAGDGQYEIVPERVN